MTKTRPNSDVSTHFGNFSDFQETRVTLQRRSVTSQHLVISSGNNVPDLGRLTPYAQINIKTIIQLEIPARSRQKDGCDTFLDLSIAASLSVYSPGDL